jgi:hypothetical protein
MAKQQLILPAEQLAEMTFPLQGLNVSTVFDQQPPGTAPVGLNVRSYESLTSRARGGSRPGLSQYIPAQVDGAFKIQHLAVIVDPQAEALPGGTPPGDPQASNRNAFGGSLGYAPVRFPNEPGRTYPRRAGVLTITAKNQTKAQGDTFTFDGTEFTVSGLVGGDSVSSVTLISAGADSGASDGTYPIVPSAAVGSGLSGYTIHYASGTMTVSGLIYVQSASNAFVAPPQANTPLTQTLAFTSNVRIGDLLIAFVFTQQLGGVGQTTPVTVTVTDSLGNTYAQAGSYAQLSVTHSLSVWYSVSASAGPCTISAQANVTTSFDLAILNYRGTKITGVLDDFSKNAIPFDPLQSTFSKNTGTVPVAGANELLVACFCQSGGGAYTVGAGFIQREQVSAIINGVYLYVEDWIGVSSGTVGDATDFFGFGNYVAIGVSFKPA